MTETVLVVGATGNIGVAAVKGALSSGRKVLAIVRNQASAERLFKHVGSSEGITTVEASITSDTGVKSVVDQVRAGKLPAFQHVHTSGGGEYTDASLGDISTEMLRRNMNIGFEANFFAYRDTVGYLREQNHANSSWTMCTGSQGDTALFALPAMTQGPLYSMATAAARENEDTCVRANEVYLSFRVEVDEDARAHGVTTSTDFSGVYRRLLDSTEIRGSRVRVESVDDMSALRHASKF